MSSDKAIAAAEADGWILECESPLELRHSATGSFASGLAAQLVLEQYANDCASCKTEREENWNALLSLQHKANVLVSQNEDWSMTYDLIFSRDLSRQVFKLCSELGSSLDYCDPDTSYEEDVRAFVTAFNSKMAELAPKMVFK